MLQDETEFEAFLQLLARERVQSYLEIGAAYGGSFLRVAERLPRPGGVAVAVDLPESENSENMLYETGRYLLSIGLDVQVIFGDSTAPDVIAAARALGPYDAVFIDGNHTLEYVAQDWMNYAPLARLVAFHDIAWKRRAAGAKIDVPEFWNWIKPRFKHVEFRSCPTGCNNGIGVLWQTRAT